jgi:hypothetical protein
MLHKLIQHTYIGIFISEIMRLKNIQCNSKIYLVLNTLDADQTDSFKPLSHLVYQRGESPLLGLDTFNVVSTVSICKEFSKAIDVKKRLRVNLSR